MYQGDYRAGDVIDFCFGTSSNGAPTTFSGSPAVRVYKGNSTTESASTGITLTADFDSRTGLNQFHLDTSLDATFYADGNDFDVVVTAGTVNGISVVGAVVGRFSLKKRSALRPTTAGRELDVSAGGEAGVDWANVGSPTTTLNLSGTTVKTATDVETDTQDIQSRLPAALGANGNLKADVRDFSGTAGTFASGRPEVNTTHAAGTAWNSGAIGASTLAADTITAAKIAADAIGASELAADAVAEIADGVWDELLSGHTTVGSAGAALSAAGSAGDPWSTPLPGAYGAGTAGKIVGTNLDGTVSSRASQTSLDTVDDYVDTEVAAIKAKTDQLTFTSANKVDATIQAAGDFAQGAADKVWSTATRALTDKVGFALSAAGVQALWDALTSALTTAGSIGKLLVDKIDATISSRLASASYTAPLDAAGTRSAVGLASANLDTQLSTIAGYVDTEVAAIKAKTDALPSDPADASDIAAAFATVNVTLATIVSYVDTEVAAIKAATDQLVAAQAEPSAVPAANATPLEKLAWLAALARNKVTQTSTTQALRNDADSANIATAPVSDDGTTFTRGEWL